MKKVILIAGIFSFSFSYAQDNDFFAIQMSLQRKGQDEKKPLYKNPIRKILFPSCWSGYPLFLLPNSILMPDRRIIHINQPDQKTFSISLYSEAILNPSLIKIRIISADDARSYIASKK